MPSKLRRTSGMETGDLHATRASPGAPTGSLLRWSWHGQEYQWRPWKSPGLKSYVARHVLVEVLSLLTSETVSTETEI